MPFVIEEDGQGRRLAADDPDGFRLRPERVEAQWKMSQNRSRADREGVAAALRARGEGAVADLVAATLAPEA